ncbi:MAG: septum site-determining protein MinC [Syntrophomonadaceae bacterium]
MSVALKSVGGEILIDLKTVDTFQEIRSELEKKLSTVADLMLGTRVNIDLGNRSLSNLQKQEIEKLLLSYGLHLNSLMYNGPPGDYLNPDSSGSVFESFAQYQEAALICRNLRSGQSFFTEGNVVILGDVNPGAEVIAGGSILVMGSLRGIAHAGAMGDENAVIAAFRLNPTQLRIASHITRPPDGEINETGNPEIARIVDEKVIINTLKI